MLHRLFFRYILPVLQALFPTLVQKLLINFLIRRETHPRPNPFSLWTGFIAGRPTKGYTAPTALAQSPDEHTTLQKTNPKFVPSNYVSWTGLVNRRYTGRHLGPADESYAKSLPPKEQVFDELLLRPPGGLVPSDNTSALFCFFAQWFTDSFLRTNPQDRRQNTSNHEIDYCQVYGLDGWTSNALRERKGGRLLLENNLLPRLTDATGAVRKQFYNIGYIRGKRAIEDGQVPGAGLRQGLALSFQREIGLERWNRMYASGLERGNSTIIYTAISTICVREHNFIAAQLAVTNPSWNDDQLFETARLIMIRRVLQIVVDDYINHISGMARFQLQRHVGEREPWYRTNRITLEFNLLYRWHGLVPDQLTVDGHSYDQWDYRFNNALLEQHGVERCINAASCQPAGRVQLYNTPSFLKQAELATLDMSRTFALQPFVQYCERFSMRPPQSIAELVGGDGKAAADLTRLYGSVDRVELSVGLIAQTRGKESPDAFLPPLVTTMVAVDAFTHILTNPVMSDQVYDFAFPGQLKDLAESGGGVAGLMARNAAPGKTLTPSFSIRQPLGSD